MIRSEDMPLSSAGSPGGSLPGNSLWQDVRESFRNPEFWAMSSWLDILARSRKSRSGILWLVAPSVVYVFGLGAFFASLFNRSLAEFAAHVALGAMIFRTLMSTVIGSATVFSSSQAFIMDGHTRLSDYLLQSLAKAFFDFCMWIPVAVIALAMFGAIVPSGFVWALPTLVLIYINALWMGVVFSLVGTRYPDFGQFLTTVSIFLFLLTPIIWYADLVPADSLRGKLMRFNPFFHFVEAFRSPILGTQIETFTYWYLAVITLAGLVVATFAYRRFARYVPLWI